MNSFTNISGAAAAERFIRIGDEYRALLEQGGPPALRLRDILSDPSRGFDIEEYASRFRPHPECLRCERRVERWARGLGAWSERYGAGYNSMTGYLHPLEHIPLSRLSATGRYYAALYFINDTLGREKYAHASGDLGAEADRLIQRLIRIATEWRVGSEAAPVEVAMCEALEAIRGECGDEFYSRFIDASMNHMKMAYREQESRARKEALSVERYREIREFVSGVWITIELMEYCSGEFIEWSDLEAAQPEVFRSLRRAQRLVASIISFENDLFSFEKEVIEDASDFNLVSIVLINDDVDLVEAIARAGRICLECHFEFSEVEQNVRRWIDRGGDGVSSQQVLAVSHHIDALLAATRVAWIWQRHTDRYARASSLFHETHQGFRVQGMTTA